MTHNPYCKCKEKRPRSPAGALIGFSYTLLDYYWPSILEKCRLNEEKFEPPAIKLTKKISHFIGEDTIRINIEIAKNAYIGGVGYANCLKYPALSALKDDVIHEAVHYLQNFFYEVNEKDYDPYSEGVAICLTHELMLEEKENRPLIISHIAGSLYSTNTPLEDIINEHLGLREKEKALIKKMIKTGEVPEHYKEKNSLHKEHAEGFVKVSKLRKDYGFDKMIKKPKKFSSYFS